MAKMTEAEALNLLAAAAALATQLAVLVPALVQNVKDIKDGLSSDDVDDLNAKVIATHEQIQTLAGQLAVLRSHDA